MPMALAPPLVLNIEYKELRGWRRAPSSCEVYVCFNTVRFLGKYGTARLHADAIACGHIGTATRRELTHDLVRPRQTVHSHDVQRSYLQNDKPFSYHFGYVHRAPCSSSHSPEKFKSTSTACRAQA